MTRLPLRLRVAGAFAASTAVLLLALGWVVYAGVERTLVSRAEDGLRARLDAVQEAPPARRGATMQRFGPGYVGQVLGPTGAVVTASPAATAPLVDVPARAGFVRRRVSLPGQQEPEDMLLGVRRVGADTLVVGTSREDVADALQQVLAVASAAGVVGLGLALVGGYLVAGLALRPVEAMRKRAETISAEEAGARLPVPPARDELHRLAGTLNDMLDRLDAGLRRERRFLAEAGHELRTPLSLLRTEIDLAVAGDRTHDELLAALRSSGDEVDRLTDLAESLLVASTGPAEQALVDVGRLAQETVARFTGVSGEDPVVHGQPDLVVRGDRARLGRALTNLVDNALRHGSGRVTVECARDGTGVRVTVADEGAVDEGLGASPLLPFVRSGASRARGGAGLGLTIAHEIASQHGGTLALRPRPAGGTEAVLWLPAPVTSAAPRSAPARGEPR